MVTEQEIKDKERSGIKQLFHSLKFLDWLVVAGFGLSIATIIIYIYYSNHPNFIETNFIIAYLLSLNHTLLIFVYGFVWAITLTVYWKVREDRMGVYCSFYIFSLFMFNFVHDITVVMLK